MYYRGMRLGAKPLGRGFPGAPTRYTSRPRRFAGFPSCTCLRRTGGLKKVGITCLGLEVGVGPGIRPCCEVARQAPSFGMGPAPNKVSTIGERSHFSANCHKARWASLPPTPKSQVGTAWLAHDRHLTGVLALALTCFLTSVSMTTFPVIAVDSC